jgi:hypothetical protein
LLSTGSVVVLARRYPCYCPGGVGTIVRNGVRLCGAPQKCPYRRAKAAGPGADEDEDDDDNDDDERFPMEDRPLCACGLHCQVRRSRPDTGSPHAGRAYFACPHRTPGRACATAAFAGWCSDEDAPRGPDCRCPRPTEAKRVRREDSPNAGRWFWSCAECGFFAWFAQGAHK